MADTMHETGSARETTPLTLFQQLSYSSGNLSTMLINQIVVTWAIYFYAPSEQADPSAGGVKVAIDYAPVAMLGFAMGFGRLIDALADPLVGHLSDRTKTRWGRRIPFVALGTPFLVLFFIILWRPPVAAESLLNALYFGLVLGFFFFFFTVVVAPYLSLMPEIARGNTQRMRVATFEAMFGIVGLLIAAIAAPLIIGDDFQFMKMALVMGAITLVFFYFSIGFVKEQRPDTDAPPPFEFKRAVAETMRNKAFVSWVACLFMFWIGFNVIAMSTPYFVTRVLGEPESKTALYQGVMMILAVPMFAVVYFAGKRLPKKILVAGAMLILTLVTPLFFFITAVPERWAGTYALALFAALSLPVATLLIMANAIIADIVDLDEQKTGRRREAMYFGMQGLVTKSAIAISAIVGTQLMTRLGMTSAEPTGILLAGPFCALFTLLGFVAITRYP